MFWEYIDYVTIEMMLIKMYSYVYEYLLLWHKSHNLI